MALLNSEEVEGGTMRLKSKEYSKDTGPVDKTCACSTCKSYSRAFLHVAFKDNNALACQLLTIHNIAYMMKLMRTMRDVSYYKSCHLIICCGQFLFYGRSIKTIFNVKYETYFLM